MNKIKSKDVVIVGFALFAMFLGAGNLILPPTVGFISGENWIVSLLGFLITAVGIPVLGIVAMAKCDGEIDKFAGPVSVGFSRVLGTLVMLIIGPLMAIPRTAATTYEMAIAPFFPGMGRLIFSIIFFAIVMFFVLSPNNVIDRVGKILTPMLILVLGAIIIKGVMTPVGVPSVTGTGRYFLRGFEEGYQTMDALGSMILATIVIGGLVQKGYADKKILFKVTCMVGVIATGGLALVYGGLTYLGATGSAVFSNELSRVELLIEISNQLWGNLGRLALAISIGLACLTTAVGLSATAGEYFEKILGGNVKYRTIVLTVAAISIFFSVFGVDNILKVAAPILAALYPVCIVLIIMNVFRELIPNKYYFIGATIGTMAISVIQGIVSAKDLIIETATWLSTYMSSISPNALSFDVPIKVIESMPLSGVGFPWIMPAIICSLLLGFLNRKKEKGF